MTLNEFQERALETANYSREYNIIYPTIGMNGEAGEVAEKVKKLIRDEENKLSPEISKAIALEIGDVLWYCAALARDIGYSLDKIGEMNYEKLMSRKNRGKIGGNGDYR